MSKNNNSPQHQQQQQQQLQSVTGVDSQVVLCTAGYDRTIRFWEALSGVCSRTIQHPDSQVNRLSISTDKRYLAACGNPNARIYEALTSNGNPISSLEGHSANVTGVSFQQNCKYVVTCSEDGLVKVWDMRAKGSQREFNHKAPVNDVVICPNQSEIVSCDLNGCVKLWDLSNSNCIHELVAEEDVAVRSVSVANDASILVAGTNSGNVYVWNMSDFRLLSRFKAHDKYLLRSILSPDVKTIATSSADSSIKLWRNIADENQNNPSQTHVYSEVRTLVGHQRWVWDLAFSADSEYLVSSSSDHTARLWDLSTGDTIRQYQGHHKAAVCVALNDMSI